MTDIARTLLSPGRKQMKAQGASGGKLHIGFSVLWCLIDSIFTDTSRWATSYIKAWTLSCLASPDAAAPAWFWVCLGATRCFRLTSALQVIWRDQATSTLSFSMLMFNFLMKWVRVVHWIFIHFPNHLSCLWYFPAKEILALAERSGHGKGLLCFDALQRKDKSTLNILVSDKMVCIGS